eukprot:CAMPEP_0172920128 /NCGR_PEP_ID=MMETSP1075-20121228/203509_1 /TAXON_ID=2916 /ORGANISM="Ceratium fusus, Strain PA161109" /LENGTH=190 /DNA_ID=CAMNT_0013780099 /DNA_START=231 /DNA_END=801 /DNA_ORIENTATION=+
MGGNAHLGMLELSRNDVGTHWKRLPNLSLSDVCVWCLARGAWKNPASTVAVSHAQVSFQQGPHALYSEGTFPWFKHHIDLPQKQHRLNSYTTWKIARLRAGVPTPRAHADWIHMEQQLWVALLWDHIGAPKVTCSEDPFCSVQTELTGCAPLMPCSVPNFDTCLLDASDCEHVSAGASCEIRCRTEPPTG